MTAPMQIHFKHTDLEGLAAVEGKIAIFVPEEGTLSPRSAAFEPGDQRGCCAGS